MISAKGTDAAYAGQITCITVLQARPSKSWRSLGSRTLRNGSNFALKFRLLCFGEVEPRESRPIEGQGNLSEPEYSTYKPRDSMAQADMLSNSCSHLSIYLPKTRVTRWPRVSILLPIHAWTYLGEDGVGKPRSKQAHRWATKLRRLQPETLKGRS